MTDLLYPVFYLVGLAILAAVLLYGIPLALAVLS